MTGGRRRTRLEIADFGSLTATSAVCGEAPTRVLTTARRGGALPWSRWSGSHSGKERWMFSWP